MLGAKTIAIFRAFILLYCSCSTTSAIKLMAQSRSAASVGGSNFTSWVQSSSVLQCITCSAVRESSTPEGSSLNHAYRSRCLFSSERKQAYWHLFNSERLTNIVCVNIWYHTFIKPAKQWTSIPRGTTPLFSWSLTYSSWLFSAFIRNIPSAFDNPNKHV